MDKDKSVYGAEKLIVHKKYNYFKLINDIGMILVDRKIEYNQDVQPVRLPNLNNVKNGDAAVLTGWGRVYVSDQ